MKTMSRTTHTERAGRWFGRVWRGVVRQEARAIRWLAGKGVPTGVAWLLFWIVKLAVFGALLYFAFWFALLLLFGVVAAWVTRNSGWDDDNKPEWREGHSGFGLYDKNEWRHDMGDPDEP
jgi:fatty acid desaturase